MLSTRPFNKAPIPPRLDSAIADRCPPLPLLATDTTAELILWAKDVAIEYAICQAKHANAVGAYDDARDTAIEANSSQPSDHTQKARISKRSGA